MENASKALLMAGGVLISLLVVGSLVLLFANLEDYQNKTNISKENLEIAKFNNQFEPFNKEDLSLIELKSVYNKLVSHNTKYKGYLEYQIEHNINESLVRNNKKNNKDNKEIIDGFFEKNSKKFIDIPEEEKINRVFSCEKIEYKDGRICRMKFKDITI